MQLPRNRKRIHEPVLVKEVIKALSLPSKARLNHQARLRYKQKMYIDATLGTGGHTKEIVKRGGYVLAIEADEAMLEIACSRLKSACPTPHPNSERCFNLIHGNFKDIDRLAKENEVAGVDGVLFDLGVSNIHFQDSKRGFSFREKKALLDMRLNPKGQEVTAADLLNSLRQDHLVTLFGAVLPINEAKQFAKKIVSKRKEKRFKVIGDLLDLTGEKKSRSSKLHPATKPLLALRMAVNSELENVKEALPKAFELLKQNGRLIIISFHSQEDSLVKNFYKKMFTQSKADILTKKPILPTISEIDANPKARSAKLRILVKK